MKPICNKKYLAFTLLLFAIETVIALYVHDAFVRPYIGDVLVVLLLYCFVKSVLEIAVFPAAVGVLLFSYCIETLQHFNFVTRLDLANHKIAKIILGSSFEWLDIAAYTVGFVLLLLLEKDCFNFKRFIKKVS